MCIKKGYAAIGHILGTNKLAVVQNAFKASDRDKSSAVRSMTDSTTYADRLDYNIIWYKSEI